MELDLLPGGEPLRARVRAFLAPWHAAGEGDEGALWDALGATGWLSPRPLADASVLLQELGYAALVTPR